MSDGIALKLIGADVDRSIVEEARVIGQVQITHRSRGGGGVSRIDGGRAGLEAQVAPVGIHKEGVRITITIRAVITRSVTTLDDRTIDGEIIKVI